MPTDKLNCADASIASKNKTDEKRKTLTMFFIINVL